MGKYETEFARLNPAQRQAVETIDGPVLVVAGPGTGKTQLLSMRVAYILQHTDTSPANIVCLTFTEAAARNMRERLVGLIGEAAYHVGIYTFHGFGTDIIQRYPEYFMDQPLVTAIDELGAYELLAGIFAELPHSNPLSLKLGDDYLHLGSARQAISWLKQAGIEPADLRSVVKANKAFIDFAEPLVKPVFAERTSPKRLPEYERLLQALRQFRSSQADSSLQDLCVEELSAAIAATDAAGRHAKPITEWRNKWLVQNRLKVWIPADRRRTTFLQALSTVYERYQAALQNRGWYTFDDMILRTSRALEQHEELRLTLQEQYQYIMVDEYQDTNGSQNRLLELLADSPVNEGRPNLLAVGDDDQAIYRFQGAHMSIMLDFLNRWRDVTQVVLTANYRSGKRLLDLNRNLIVQGQDRLENHVPELSKQLVAERSDPAKDQARLTYTQTVSELDQYAYVADEISRLIKDGATPGSIAVLAPKHSYLQALVPYLLDRKLPVTYERREHILSQPRIIELLDLARLVQAAGSGDWAKVDSLMPLVLAADYWQLDPLVMWTVSVEAYRTKRLWLEIMLKHQNKQLQRFAQAVPVLARAAAHTPMEHMLDLLLGNQPITLPGNETWHIPYRQNYFGETQLQQTPQEYFTLLGQLTSLRQRLREYRPDKTLGLADVTEFVSLYEQSKLTLLDTNPHTVTADAVELMTAYKAKGLEWDTVFILGAHDNIWGTRTRGNTYSFGLPSNLAWIKPARDSHDDHLRLLYVAMTRARNNLYLTSFQQNLNGKKAEPISWFVSESMDVGEPALAPLPATVELVRTQELQWSMTPRQHGSLHDSLKPYLETYKLSATHLNSFVDLTKGGPKHFFFRHILHFPEAATPSSVYGSAIHQTLHYLHNHYSRSGTLPKLATLQKLLANDLRLSNLPAADKERLIQRGRETLARFYTDCSGSLRTDDKSEYSFAREGVVLGPARLTGKIDVIRQLGDNRLAILDYKTGAPLANWRPKGAYAQVRAHLYQQQLGFYHFLVNGSAHFNHRQVDHTLLQFVEPDEDGNLLELEYKASIEELSRLEQLVAAVWQHVMDLDFPDTSAYSLDLKGVKQFEQDLLDGKV